MNKAVIDPIAPRYTAIGKATACRLTIENGPEEAEAREAPLHPKNAAIGNKMVYHSKELYIE